MDLRERLQTLRAEYGELAALAPVVGVGYRWQIASGMAAAQLHAAGRDLARGGRPAAVAAQLAAAELAIRRMRGMVARRGVQEYATGQRDGRAGEGRERDG